VFVSFFISSFFFLNAQNENMDLKEPARDTVFTANISEKDTVHLPEKDSIDSSQSPKKKEAINAEIVYSARDSIVFYGDGVAYLYGNAQVNYEKMELISDNIRINMDSSNVQARGRIDSAGVLVETPIFKDGPDQYESKSIDYNFKTQKGFIRGVITQHGDGFITSDRAKKLDNNVFLMIDGKYTTCDDHEHPHFYLNLTKAKIKPNQFVVAGPAYLVIADVPLPLIIPFGYFPFTEKYSSGILMPSYGEESARGFFLRNGGYYFALSDYYDLAIRGDIYTKGSWGLNATSRYTMKYKFNGNFYASYIVTIQGEETLADYTRSNDMKIMWTHSQDPKANPFRTFSASVNFSSAKYNKNNVDSRFSPTVYGENNTSSSINYNYRFPESPFSITANITANQRQSDSTLSLTLPTFRLDMSRVFPFKSANRIGKEKWYEKVYLTYNFDFSNSITSKQDKVFDSFNDWDNGIRHQLNLGASYNLLKYLTVSPSVNYSERWYFKRIERHWDREENKEAYDTLNAFFYPVRNLSANLDFNTQLFGFFKPIPALFGKKVDMIRHMFQPSVGFSLSPGFGGSVGKYYRPIPYVTDDSTRVAYSYFNGVGATEGGRGSINFRVENNLEMKITSKKDSTGFRKISLIDNLSAGISYDAFADSLNWSDISTSMRLKLTKNVSVTINARFTPYIWQLNEFNNPVKTNVTELERNGRLARLTNVGTSFGYSFSNEMFKKKTQTKHDEKKDEQVESKTDSEFGEEGYLLFKMPWNFRFDYSINYNDGLFNKEKLEFEKRINQSLNFSGNITFSKGWQFNFSSGWDFEAKKISYSSCGITRDLHCWTASLNLVPFGVYRSYNFLIRVKSSLLQDLKYEQQSDPGDNPVWY
jgi:lipopolysaccharide assembly outer membrane protein LptD (OstA)